ncbi:MAG: ATP-binding protein [Clostridia bacterium]|nr:ATP-binding protein [Clostridia bacterium]
MREISLHILDIVQNSIKAGADLIKISIREDIKDNIMVIDVVDNGKGIPEEMLGRVTDPFVTMRSTRKVGMGLPLLKAAAERCDGSLEVKSELDKGTAVRAVFVHDHIDRAPLGDVTGTIVSLIMTNPDIDFEYIHYYNQEQFQFDTRSVREVLGDDVPISDIEVIQWIKGYIDEGISKMYGGVI